MRMQHHKDDMCLFYDKRRVKTVSSGKNDEINIKKLK